VEVHWWAGAADCRDGEDFRSRVPPIPDPRSYPKLDSRPSPRIPRPWGPGGLHAAGGVWYALRECRIEKGTSAVVTIPFAIAIVGLTVGLGYQEPAQPKKPSGWTTYTPREGDFRAEFPAKPQEQSRISPSAVGAVETRTYHVRSGGCLYLVQRIRYSRPFPVLQVAQRLEQQKQAYLQGQAQLVRESQVTLGDVVGQQFEYQTASPRANGTVSHLTRHFIRGPSYYVVTVTTSPEQPLPREADRFLESFAFAAPAPVAAKKGAMAKGEGEGRPGTADATPEEALRTFMVAVVTHDKATLRDLSLPNPELDWLVRGEAPPAEVVDRVRTLAKAMKIRRLKAGDRIRGPQGVPVEVRKEDVGEDRALLLPEGAPEPVRLQRVEGRWKVDARPAISQRKQAATAPQKAGGR
jgi:hypothetical protein